MAKARKIRLEGQQATLLRKLADPKDADDPRWVRRMLGRVEVSQAKTERAMEHKEQQKAKHKRRDRET
jgi:hypothetical protein